MKKLMKLMAVACTMAMLLGMTAMAAPSPTTDPTPSQAMATGWADGVTATADGLVISIEETTLETLNSLTDATMQNLCGAGMGKYKAFEAKVVSGTIPSTGVEITFNVPGIKAGQTVYVLHRNHQAVWESMPIVAVADGKVVAKFWELSPIAIVTAMAAAAPKTGETVPVAGVFVIVALAGVAFCLKKYELCK